MLEKYMELTDIFVQNKLGTNREAQKYDRVGATTNIILIDILKELQAIRVALEERPVVEEAVEKPKAEDKVEEANPKKSTAKSTSKGK